MQQPSAAPILPEEPANPTRAASYSITDDPIFYGTVIMFTLLTTIMPAILGQPRFMPVVQTLALTTFLAMTVRRQKMRQIVTVLLMWLLIQLILITLLSWAAPGSLAHAIPNGLTGASPFGPGSLATKSCPTACRCAPSRASANSSHRPGRR
ncbi:MAG: hypothetical protein R2911_38285 [Caldilineaceae bacterium]